MQRLILAEACFFAQFGWTLLILCRCSAAPNSLDAPLKSLILYALALILHALYPFYKTQNCAHPPTPFLRWFDSSVCVSIACPFDHSNLIRKSIAFNILFEIAHSPHDSR